jgi:hypothetical protein
MTPKFYSHFTLLQKTLAAYNKKCDCKGVDATITFEQILKTREDNNSTLWIAKFTSETFGDQRFGGTVERVSELITIFIEQIIRQTLEACIANSEEWYKDKPEVKVELYDLHAVLVGLGGPI